MMRTINKMLAPLSRRMRLMVSRAVIVLVNDSLKTQRLQLNVLKDEVPDGVERFAEYGFTSAPHKGCQAVVVSIGGSRSHMIVIATHDGNSRLSGLAEGEVALYDDLGQKVHLTRNGIVIDGAGKDIKIQNTPNVIADTPKFTFMHDVEIFGKLDVTEDITGQANMTANALLSIGDITAFCTSGSTISMGNMKLTYNGHQHNDPVSGVTSTPSNLM